jgi:hypothetical protein
MRRLFLGFLFATSIASACSTSTNDSDDKAEGSGGLGGADDGHDHVHTGGSGASDQGGAGGEAPSELKCDAPSTCGLSECEAPLEEGLHSAMCAELTPHTNPPTSGTHYPSWAAFGVYDEPIPAGFLLHSLEHSAVALLYNCQLVEAAGDSCNDLEAELLAFYDDFPDDPLCSDVPHRLMIVPDPHLDSAFAAAAWGYHLKGDCFDAERVSAFIDAHYGQNYEDICASGIGPEDTDCWP